MKAGSTVALCLSAAAAAACIWESSYFFKCAFGGCGSPRIVLGPRRTVERFVPRGSRVTLYRSDAAEHPSQVCRSIFLSMAWAAGAGNVEEKWSLDGSEPYVLVAPVAFTPDSLTGNPRYRKLTCDGVGCIWVRDDAQAAAHHDCDEPAAVRDNGIAPVARECADWREPLVLLPFAALACALAFAGMRRAPSRWGTACACTVFALNALFALSHTFNGPCGTGVFGGRAKALVESGWDIGRLADPGMGEYFQAAYPPLQALVTAAGYSIAGVCGEWLTQLGPVLFLAAAFLVMEGIAEESGCRPLWAKLLLPAACLANPMVHATGNFCGEPLMLLFVAAGWAMVRRDDDRGWFLVGLAGLVKNEGVFYAPAVIMSEIVAGRFRARGLVDLALGLVPVAMWHVVSRWAGASLYDYAPPWQPDITRALAAFRALLLEIVRHPWRYAAVVWGLGVIAVARFGGRAARRGSAPPEPRVGMPRDMLAAMVFFAGVSLCVCYAFALSRAPCFRWHVACLPRLLAPAAALALAVACGPRCRAA